MHRRGVSTFCCGCAALQCVAGPIENSCRSVHVIHVLWDVLRIDNC